jgi:hypothetical protein
MDRENDIQACRQSNGTTKHIRRNKYGTYQVITLRKEDFSNSEYRSMFTERVYVVSYPPWNKQLYWMHCTFSGQWPDVTHDRWQRNKQSWETLEWKRSSIRGAFQILKFFGWRGDVIVERPRKWRNNPGLFVNWYLESSNPMDWLRDYCWILPLIREVACSRKSLKKEERRIWGSCCRLSVTVSQLTKLLSTVSPARAAMNIFIKHPKCCRRSSQHKRLSLRGPRWSRLQIHTPTSM